MKNNQKRISHDFVDETFWQKAKWFSKLSPTQRYEYYLQFLMYYKKVPAKKEDYAKAFRTIQILRKKES
ncbi:MAG: hypothetical protein DRH57_05080 [Candidatus Cloacimonadota bacterium]|nr:MAG: hypothetical protein DRH57_05080 [Candidatus Cloacimonadota bacterium]